MPTTRFNPQEALICSMVLMAVTDQRMSDRELAAMSRLVRELPVFSDFMPSEIDRVTEIVDDRPGKDAAYTLDSTKARQALGWQDTVTLEDGIRGVITWVDAHLPEIQRQPFDYIHKP